MASRPSLSSALRCHWSALSSDAKLNGSKPRSPGSVPSRRAGRGRNGSEADIFMVDVPVVSSDEDWT